MKVTDEREVCLSAGEVATVLNALRERADDDVRPMTTRERELYDGLKAAARDVCVIRNPDNGQWIDTSNVELIYGYDTAIGYYARAVIDGVTVASIARAPSLRQALESLNMWLLEKFLASADPIYDIALVVARDKIKERLKEVSDES